MCIKTGKKITKTRRRRRRYVIRIPVHCAFLLSALLSFPVHFYSVHLRSFCFLPSCFSIFRVEFVVSLSLLCHSDFRCKIRRSFGKTPSSTFLLT
mmetsp:Transcript_27183/g.37455  ORF Transcript_27183/g.37455 Transcript_27183/m.37455 type:complete len:95 (-) Transcript_27183:1701-1985(-)